MRIYLKIVLMNIKSQLEYRKAFTISVIGSFLLTFILTISVYFLFMEFKEIGGWNFYQVALLFGIVYLDFSITEMFFRGLDHFDDIIRKGEFDRFLIRPQNLLIQVICKEFDLSKLGRMIQSALIVIIAILKLNIDWNLYKIFVFILINIGCILIFLGTFILRATFCFWTIDGLEFMNIISEGGKKVAQYPINIYEKWFRRFFTYIIPIGMINYFPVLYLLGKIDKWYYGLTPFVTLIFVEISMFMWKIGVRHYESTGS